MLKLKVLKGPNAGQSITLKQGENVVGRQAPSTIIFESGGVSKQHAKITVKGEQCSLTDTSSNGTFVNGRRVKDAILRSGDKIAFHDIIVQLVSQSKPAANPQMPQQFPQQFGQPQYPPQQQWNQNVAYQQQPGFNYQGQPQMQQSPAGQQAPYQEPKSAFEFVQVYVEKVVLPGVYYLAEMYPMKYVIGTILLAFVLMVTFLSSIPMAELTKDGIQKESLRRAQTIARQLAAVSERALANGGETNVRTDFAENEDGVQVALVISREDGHIIAPVTKQDYSNNEFVVRARKYDRETSESLGGTLIGASAPIRAFSSEAGSQMITAQAVIIYKMDTVDWSATSAVFARVLIIAVILGAIIFFLITKLVAHPIKDVTAQLDLALRGEKDTVGSKINFEELQKLVSDINSAISRMGQPNNQPQAVVDRESDARNIVRMTTEAAFALNRDMKFIEVNEAFGDLTGMRQAMLEGQGLETLSDPALKLNLEDVIQRARGGMGLIQQSQLEIGGSICDISVVVTQDPTNPEDMSYVFGTIKKRSES